MSILLRMSTVLLLLCSVTACNDKAKEHKDELREGTWYVYDIEYDYQFIINTAHRNWPAIFTGCSMNGICCFCREMNWHFRKAG